MGADSSKRLSNDVDRGTSRDHRPVGACHVEFEIGARGVAILRDGARLGGSRASQRRRSAAGINGPLQIDPRAHVIGDVRINQAAARNPKLVDMICPGISGLQSELRHRRGLALILDGPSRFLPRVNLGDAMAGLETARDRIVQRQADGRLGSRIREPETKQHEHNRRTLHKTPSVTRAMNTSSSDVGTCRTLSGWMPACFSAAVSRSGSFNGESGSSRTCARSPKS